MSDTLFDLEPYGGAQTAKEKRTASREASSSPLPPIELLTNGWRLIRNRRGMLPFAHLVKVVSTEGGALTMCNEWGTTLPRFDDDTGMRCPLCDMETQLH